MRTVPYSKMIICEIQRQLSNPELGYPQFDETLIRTLVLQMLGMKVISHSTSDSQFIKVDSPIASLHSAFTNKATRYNPIAGAGVVATLIAGTAGVSSFIVLGLCVLAAIIGTLGVRQELTRAQCALFWLIYINDDHRVKRSEAERKFLRIDEEKILKPEDFAPALAALLGLGCVVQTGDYLRTSESVWI